MAMEQYAHLLIPSDPEFLPKAEQVGAFYDLLLMDFHFQYVKSKKDWMPGLLGYNSAEIIRIGRNGFTGEEMPQKRSRSNVHPRSTLL